MGVTFTENINNTNFLVAVINANKCAGNKAFIDEMRSCFNFPYGDFNDMNILNDCMTDLGWLKERNFILRVKNIKVLESKSIKHESALIETLKGYKDYWDEEKRREKKRDENNFIIEYL